MSISASVPEAGRPEAASDAAMLASLLAHTPVGFAFVDPDFRLHRVSESLAEMTGVAAADQLGRALNEVWPARLAEAAETAVRKVLSDGTPVLDSRVSADDPAAGNGLPGVPSARSSAGNGLPRPGGTAKPHTAQGGPGTAQDSPGNAQAGAANGRTGASGSEPSRERRLTLSCYPAGDQGGAIAGVTLIAVDVTGEEAAAESLRRTTERYRSLVQSGNQVVWVTDPSGRVAEDSPEWRWITGQSPEEYQASGWLAAVHPDDLARTEREWRECVRTGAALDGTYRIRTKSGSYRYYDVRAVPIERDGAVVEWMGASTDVTGQREADEMRGRLTEQLSAAALRTSRLQQATSSLAGELSVMGVVGVITEVGQSAIGADRSAVALVSKDRMKLRIISSDGTPDGPGELSGEVPLDLPSVMAAAIAQRRPLICDSPQSLRRQFEADADVDLFLGNTDEKAWVGLPLIASGEPIGALEFSFTSPRQITDEDRVFLEALAGQCALALERAMLYEREHTTAETLQRSLLPDKLPEVPGVALKARYRPVTQVGRDGIEVGGDWYDAFRLPDGKLAIAAGDVMGKGLTAAAGMGRVRNALRALALTDPRPAAVLAGLDRLFIATELDEQVTTVCYLVVDPVSGDGVIGNAGHLPPLLFGPGQRPRLYETEEGTPLGWASPRTQYPFSVPPGNTAVLYSDGLVENRKRGLNVGLDELVTVVAQAPAETVADPDQLIDYLVDKMVKDHEQDDDVTVLVLQMPARGPSGRTIGGERESGRD